MTHPQAAASFSNSKFYMWRSIIALAHADGMVHAEETAWLVQMFNNMRNRAGLSEEQYNILIDDLESPRDVASLMPHIDEPSYRAQVIYFARLLAFKDGHLHPSEEELLDKLHAQTMQGIDMKALRAEVSRNVQTELVLHEAARDSQRPDKPGLTKLVDELALCFGVDLMD